MTKKNDIYPLYLQQLQGIQTFRQAYHGMYQTQALEQDDPELKRLTEAIAYCSAHAQHHGQRTLVAQQRNLLAQIHPYMITPLPAKSLLQVVVSEKLQGSMLVKAGTEFHLQGENGQSAIFQTCRPMQVLPLRYTGLETQPSGLRDIEIHLQFKALSTQTKAPGKIPLFLDVCQDFRHSLKLYQALLPAEIKVSFDFADESYQADFTAAAGEFLPGMHPVETCRQQFHFPNAQFCLELDIADAPANWQNLTVNIRVNKDLLPDWQADYFTPFCVPVINLHHPPAQRLQVDGTRVHYPICPPDIGADWALHSVLGVYQLQDKQRTPIMPSVLSSALAAPALTANFSLLIDEQVGEQQSTILDINLPNAFAKPCAVEVDGYWLQPAFSSHLWQKIQLTPLAMDIPGVSWQLAGPRVKQQAAIQKVDRLNGLLAVRSNEVLAAEHINALVSYISLEWAKEFDLIAERYLGALPLSQLNQFALRLRLSKTDIALAELFLSYIKQLIACWFAPQSVELSLELVE